MVYRHILTDRISPGICPGIREKGLTVRADM